PVRHHPRGHARRPPARHPPGPAPRGAGPPVSAVAAPITLRRGRLDRTRAALATAGGIALTLLLFAVTPMAGRADFLVVAWFLGVGAYLAAAVVVEGRRAATDRLFHALVVASVGVCLLA